MAEESGLRHVPAAARPTAGLRRSRHWSGLACVLQEFSPTHGMWVPSRFSRVVCGRWQRLVTCVVEEVLDVWHVPIAWWRTDGGTASGLSDMAAVPDQRVVWRVLATPVIAAAGVHICAGGIVDIAQEPDGTWSVVRVHG